MVKHGDYLSGISWSRMAIIPQKPRHASLIRGDGLRHPGHVFIHVNNQVQWREFIRPWVISKLLIEAAGGRPIDHRPSKEDHDEEHPQGRAGLTAAGDLRRPAPPERRILVLLSSETPTLPLQRGKSLTTGIPE